MLVRKRCATVVSRKGDNLCGWAAVRTLKAVLQCRTGLRLSIHDGDGLHFCPETRISPPKTTTTGLRLGNLELPSRRTTNNIHVQNTTNFSAARKETTEILHDVQFVAERVGLPHALARLRCFLSLRCIRKSRDMSRFQIADLGPPDSVRIESESGEKGTYFYLMPRSVH